MSESSNQIHSWRLGKTGKMDAEKSHARMAFGIFAMLHTTTYPVCNSWQIYFIASDYLERQCHAH